MTTDPIPPTPRPRINDPEGASDFGHLHPEDHKAKARGISMAQPRTKHAGKAVPARVLDLKQQGGSKKACTSLMEPEQPPPSQSQATRSHFLPLSHRLGPARSLDRCSVLGLKSSIPRPPESPNTSPRPATATRLPTTAPPQCSTESHQRPPGVNQKSRARVPVAQLA